MNEETLIIENQIKCQDGSISDISIGCVDFPSGIVNPNSNIINIMINFSDVLINIAIVLTVIFLIIGGLKYSLSIGNDEKINESKKIIYWSIIGLIICLIAKGIVTLIIKNLI